MTDWLANNAGTVTTLGFFTSFFIILFWAYMPSHKKNLQDQAMIPFRELSDD